jgi:hypothetical protein
MEKIFESFENFINEDKKENSIKIKDLTKKIKGIIKSLEGEGFNKNHTFYKDVASKSDEALGVLEYINKKLGKFYTLSFDIDINYRYEEGGIIIYLDTGELKDAFIDDYKREVTPGSYTNLNEFAAGKAAILLNGILDSKFSSMMYSYEFNKVGFSIARFGEYGYVNRIK